MLSLGIPLIFCDADVAWLADARRALTHANQPSNPRPSLRFSSEVRYWETPPGRSANTGVYSALPDPGAIRVFSRAIERRCVPLRHSVRSYPLAACIGTAEAVPRRNKLPGHGCVARPFSYCIRPHPAVPQFAWLVSGRCNAPSFVWLAAGLNVVAVAAASTWTVLTLVRRRCRVSVTRI